MKTKIALIASIAITVIPLSASAYVDCRDTDNGCTVAQLVEISNQTFLSSQDRVSALQQAVAMLTKQIAVLSGQSSAVSNTNAASCIDLPHNINPGSRDSGYYGGGVGGENYYISHGNEVSALQQFLGVSVTGYYGPLTAEAVVRWQKAHGMDFVTTKSGVGPMTRAKMACSASN